MPPPSGFAKASFAVDVMAIPSVRPRAGRGDLIGSGVTLCVHENYGEKLCRQG